MARRPGAAAIRSTVQVGPEVVRHLGDQGLRDLMSRLLLAEAHRCGVDRSRVIVNAEIKATRPRAKRQPHRLDADSEPWSGCHYTTLAAHPSRRRNEARPRRCRALQFLRPPRTTTPGDRRGRLADGHRYPDLRPVVPAPPSAGPALRPTSPQRARTRRPTPRTFPIAARPPHDRCPSAASFNETISRLRSTFGCAAESAAQCRNRLLIMRTRGSRKSKLPKADGLPFRIPSWYSSEKK